ncbi:MAG TPA: hypothetical protein PLX35_15815 [Cyclobacteriaceae bacterium]|nr:hypothetical protein [Cyclobacteriaceae bacterium]
MIYVFRTSVRTKKQVKKLKPHLEKILPGSKTNFDLMDCDKILRIDSQENITATIRNLLQEHHFVCEELE